MAVPKLHYFDVNGYGEGCRLLLHYIGKPFEDVRYNLTEWTPETKKEFPFGQLPVYEIPGKGSLNQSAAIARYIGQTNGLTTGDAWTDAKIDAAVLTLYDFMNKLTLIAWNPDAAAKEAAKKVLMEETHDFYFSRLEKIIAENNGFVGGQLTWADFVLVGLIECGNLYMDVQLEEKYPSIKALIQKVYSYPGVKKYLATRKTYVKPFEQVANILKQFKTVSTN